MGVEQFVSNEAARTKLRARGFRQLTFPSNQDPEFWWKDDTAEAAEVARKQIFTYLRKTNAWQEVAKHVRKPLEKGFRSTMSEENASDFSRLASLEGFLRIATEEVHKANERWWRDLTTDQPIQRNVGELLMLCVSELSEAMEGHRKGLMDDKLPHRPMIEVELADCLIRLLDLAGGLKLDLAGAFLDKMEYNAKRHDHTKEARLQEGGKKY